MPFLIDTNIISFALRNQHGVMERLLATPVEELRLSVIVQAEGWTGAWKSPHPERWLRLWKTLVGTWPVVPFDAACADRYARLRAELERRGCMFGLHDCQIAATALVHGLVLVTDNDTEFRRVPGLQVENWGETLMASEQPNRRSGSASDFMQQSTDQEAGGGIAVGTAESPLGERLPHWNSRLGNTQRRPESRAP